MSLSSEQQAHLLALAADGYVCDQDVMTLRKAIFPDGIVSRSELETLFAIGEQAGDPATSGDPAWPQLFAEVCADFFLHEEQPEGYLTEEEFTHLQALVTRDNKRASALELHALSHLMTRARQVPATMARFLKDQLLALVAARPQPAIAHGDLPLIRAVIYAGGGANAFGISREEADFLFDLHDATAKAGNADGWRELFVKAISAHLMQHVGYQPIDREEALRRQEWVEDTSVQPGRFFNAMVSGGLKGIADAFKRKDEWTLRNEAHAAAVPLAQRVCGEETLWLDERIGRDGNVDDAERALIVYMRDELNAPLPERLLNLIGDVGANAAA